MLTSLFLSLSLSLPVSLYLSHPSLPACTGEKRSESNSRATTKQKLHLTLSAVKITVMTLLGVQTSSCQTFLLLSFFTIFPVFTDPWCLYEAYLYCLYVEFCTKLLRHTLRHYKKLQSKHPPVYSIWYIEVSALSLLFFHYPSTQCFASCHVPAHLANASPIFTLFYLFNLHRFLKEISCSLATNCYVPQLVANACVCVCVSGAEQVVYSRFLKLFCLKWLPPTDENDTG